MSSPLRRVGVVAACGAAALLTSAAPAGAAGTIQPLRKLGTVNVREAAANAKPAPYRPSLRNSPAQLTFARFEARRHPEEAGQEGIAPAAAALAPPTVPGLPITSNEVQRGWEGLDIRDTVFSQGFELEPPDQGLCGGTVDGTTFLWEETNLALALYDTSGSQFTPPALGLNELYGVPPAVDFENEQPEFGPFLSDPKCYFDTQTGRWYHTTLEIDVDPDTGDFTGGAHTLIAASTSRDPLGPYNIFSIDESHANCVLCIGDQPLLGADANALVVSTATYDLAPPEGSPGFFGPQIYAIDKRALSNGTADTIVHFEVGVQKTATLQPATTPSGRFETAQLGTEYLMGAFDCEIPDCSVDPDSLENTIQLWGLSRTFTLRTANPTLRLFLKTLDSQVYGQPFPQSQKDGVRPLGESHRAPNPEIEANDARMNQVVYAGGRLWGAVNTRVAPGDRDGIAWFQVDPQILSTQVKGVIRKQGYVAANRDHTFLSFPSIGVNDRGRGVIAYSFMGDDFFPSAGYTTIDRNRLRSGVTIARNGFKPEDGFTCYEAEGFGPACRWGDYSASFALPNGEVWSAAEFIGDNARTTFANWSTFVWPLRP